uniref:Uncharacterized protein n=1 Tax=Arundo donax TaxID=35708 RepID=A0A0A9F5L9_ARUDO
METESSSTRSRTSREKYSTVQKQIRAGFQVKEETKVFV